ncbi:DUF72 domain-containing protein [Kushneria phosphatilytica]|uniref:DUF72 domain-containing protein n=1 Tax=Kushneria phosphatilytica TaxID=657387 RepID=A0A1S1NNM0_9GAMM|nr:DUF72 domain-containing protein [Kushneria phosphatilytica]OHV08872.1 hypothetical protein BH688_12755 [Kushneria phosphatilytica]QEL12593.1 DUF72 domain-containing protein [Kushneria phosphatilytica]
MTVVQDTQPSLHLGLAMWANADWRGSLYPAALSTSEALPEYARVFDTVEGNTTFYSGAPRPETVESWSRQAPEHFRFCFKLPARLTHEQRLVGIEAELADFLDRLAPLHDRLGPVMVQLPRDFGYDELPVLATLLERWPAAVPCAVEVRASEFFHKGLAERALNRLLITHAVDRVMLDVRALFATDAGNDERLRQAQREKPHRPLHVLATGQRPLVRFIGHFDEAINEARMTPWLDRLCEWLDEGREPWMFVHTPDNRQAPELARRFHERLRQRLALPALPDFAGERQSSLF